MSNIYGKTCAVEGCEKFVLARGWCHAHYSRWHRHGDPLGGGPSNLRGLGPMERLLSRRTINSNGCWVISGASRNGYARMQVGKALVSAHRWAYEQIVGPVPDGLVLDHLCRNRACANPEHLEPVTFAENVRRGVGPTAVNARKNTCKRGHSLADAYIVPSTGSRQCRHCHPTLRKESA